MSEFAKKVAQAGGFASGGPVSDDFSEGWAVAPFVGKGTGKAHYWKADRRFVEELPNVKFGLESLCGVKTVATDQVPLLLAGSIEPCSRCDKASLSGRFVSFGGAGKATA